MIFLILMVPNWNGWRETRSTSHLHSMIISYLLLVTFVNHIIHHMDDLSA